jgi:hypothetical protein
MENTCFVAISTTLSNAYLDNIQAYIISCSTSGFGISHLISDTLFNCSWDWVIYKVVNKEKKIVSPRDSPPTFVRSGPNGHA